MVFFGNGFLIIGRAIGQYLETKDELHHIKSKQHRALMIMILAFIICTVVSFANKGEYSPLYHYHVVMALSLIANPILFVVTGCSGSIFIIELARLLFNKTSLLSKWGKETLSMMAIHISMVLLAEKVLQRIVLPNWIMMIILLISTSIVLCVSGICSSLIGKVVPNLSGRR